MLIIMVALEDEGSSKLLWFLLSSYKKSASWLIGIRKEDNENLGDVGQFDDPLSSVRQQLTIAFNSFLANITIW